MSNDNQNPKQTSGLVRLAGPLALVFILGGASLYAFGGLSNRSGTKSDGECKAAELVSARLKPLAKGDIAALQVSEKPKLLRDLSFQNANGQPVTLASLRGKAILLNLWATWCAPCRQEMPALDALQAQLGGADFEVVAVNIDTRNFEKPKAFLAEIDVKNLAYYADPQAKIFQDLKAVGRAFGMPTTILIDKNGCELAHLSGPAEWSGKEALALVKAALGR